MTAMKFVPIVLVAALPSLAMAQVPPIQSPPGMAADASNAVVPNALANLAAGGAVQLHQNAGGDIANWGPTSSCPGGLLRANADMPLCADMIDWISRDASVQVYACAATPHTGDSVGVDWTVSGTTYHERYTVQAGDTTTQVATGIGNAINGDSALLAALAAYRNPASGAFKSDGIGYQPYQTPVSNQTANGCTIFDAPDGVVPSAVSGGGGTTVTVAGSTLAGATPALDGGPSFILGRDVPGHPPHIGDKLGQIIFQGATGGSANSFAMVGSIFETLTSPTAAALTLQNNTGDNFNLESGYQLLQNAGHSTYYAAIKGSGGQALFGVSGHTPFIQQDGSGTEVQMQTTGGALTQVAASALRLGGATSGSVTVKAASVAGSSTLTLPAGTTDLSGSGPGFLAQTATGGALTVALPAYADQSPSNPTGTSSSTAKMQGLGADTAGSGAHPCTITPSVTGRVRFTISGTANYHVQGQTMTIHGREGTGTAPANAVAVTGSVFGNSNGLGYIAGQVYEIVPFEVTGIVTGLSLGTAVWFDLDTNAGDNSSTATVFNPHCTATEF